MPLGLVPENILIEQLPRISRMVASIARRHALSADVAAEFESWVRMRLVEDDYAVLRKFRGESAITTYLTVVVAQLFRDYRAREWGRWRPSAAAQRRGPLAVRLETLLYRDGYTLDQAIETLNSSSADRAMPADRRSWLSLVREFPVRAPLRPVEFDSGLLDSAVYERSADVELQDVELERQRARTHALVQEVLLGLDPEDQAIVRARYWEGMSIADIARMLGLEQKPLYRRLERLHTRVRAKLEASGLTSEHVLAHLADD